MKAWIVAVVALALGIASGVAAAWMRVENEPADLSQFQPRVSLPVVSDVDADEEIEQYPRVQVVGSNSYDFGTMARDATQRHTFVVRNAGQAPLTLEVIETTCKCAIGLLEKDEVQPFESAEITLEWTADSYELDFRQSAIIGTNDHRQETLRLTVHGKVQQIIRPVPTNVVLTNLSPNEVNETPILIYAYRDDDFQIIDPQFTNLEQDHFDFSVTALTDEQLASEPNAKSGVEIMLKTKVGIPAGPFEQSLRMNTNLPDVEILEIPIRGRVGSDISVVTGRYRYSKQLQRLYLDPISGKTGGTVQIFFLVKGPYREDVKLSVGKVDPENILKVTINQPKLLRKVLMYPVILEVPPGSPSVNRKGTQQGEFAEFVIETTHPDVPEVKIEVELYVH